MGIDTQESLLNSQDEEIRNFIPDNLDSQDEIIGWENTENTFYSTPSTNPGSSSRVRNSATISTLLPLTPPAPESTKTIKKNPLKLAFSPFKNKKHRLESKLELMEVEMLRNNLQDEFKEFKSKVDEEIKSRLICFVRYHSYMRRQNPPGYYNSQVFPISIYHKEILPH